MSLDTDIQQALAVLEPEWIALKDESALHAGHAGAAGGGHYHLHLISKQFSGLRLVARHRLIYAALAPLMQRGIHALSIEAQAPEEAF